MSIIHATSFYWRNDTLTSVTLRSTSPNKFIPEIVSPLHCSSRLVRHTLLFVIISKNSFLSFAPWTNATLAFSTLWLYLGLLYWGLTPQQLRSYYGGRWRICFSWLSYTSTNTTFLSKAIDYFSHMLLQR